MDMILTGRGVDSKEAYEMGLSHCMIQFRGFFANHVEISRISHKSGKTPFDPH
jgi:hypothetical protein